eukprot:TRINITY_DN16570_c0_g1_i1.p1 TRINITY_DN16570_c0_g1~~TRINITY_DN16570_c0_g1_i1.p1  ORF type:complete len:557 (+),score=147.06 TRINITY_DN16570_c0_g1_i1:126-1673(+)
MILGMVWAIILDFQIKGISVEELSAEEGLLLWCQRKTKGYRDVNIENFTTSWVNGLALAALIHRHRPDLIDFDSLHKENRAANLRLCFDIAEKELGIPPLLDVEDLVNVARPDERSVMTYISEFFHKFSSQDSKETAARRVQKFVQFSQGMEEMEAQYVASANDLLTWIQSTIEALSNREFGDDLEHARALLEAHKAYKLHDKPAKNSYKLETEAAFTNILTKLRSNNRTPWTPPPGLSVNDIDAAWESLALAENERSKALREHISKLKEQLRVHYANNANNFYNWVTQLKKEVVGIDGPLSDQHQLLLHKLQEINTGSKLKEVEDISHLCDHFGIDENPHTDFTIEELSLLLDQVKNIASKKAEFIDGQLLAQTKKGVDPALIKEYKETFRHFDKDNSNSLDKLEFKACLAGLGVGFRDDEAFDSLYQSIVGDQDQVYFDPFVDWMIKQTEDTDTASQLNASFKSLANDQHDITPHDLQVHPLTPNEIGYIVERFPRRADRLDYTTFVNGSFAV